MACGYKPYFDPDFESLIERIYPPRVVVDNETCQNSTLVKVDSKNKHGILLEMVQVLTDLDLLISKSYISSDGGWFMDVFHVTDQLGNKVTDDTLIHYIQQALCARRGSSKSKSKGGGTGAKEVVLQQKKWLPGSVVGSSQISSTEYTAFEMTANDRPGLLSEVSAVLAQLGFHVAAAAAWTHNTRAACIFYVEDEKKNCCSNNNKGGGGGRSDESTVAGAGRGIISDESRLAEMEEQLENVVGAHHGNGERRMVRLASPAAARTHMERRLHQLMYADGDYEEVEVFNGGGGRGGRGGYTSTSNNELEVSIENCNEREYSVVSVRCTDRPKLLFDTVCTLTDMEYVVFHAAISSKGSLAIQEYYIRHVDGCTMDTESERRRVIQCLVAAIERRVSHGLKLDLCTRNRVGLLSDVTRVFREHGLSVSRAEIGTRGEKAIGSFYVTDASGNDADPRTVELLRKEIGVTALEISRSPGKPSYRCSSSNSSSNNSSSNNISTCSVDIEERTTRSSLGSLLWAQLGRFSSNFGPIKS